MWFSESYQRIVDYSAQPNSRSGSVYAESVDRGSNSSRISSRRLLLKFSHRLQKLQETMKDLERQLEEAKSNSKKKVHPVEMEASAFLQILQKLDDRLSRLELNSARSNTSVQENTETVSSNCIQKFISNLLTIESNQSC